MKTILVGIDFSPASRNAFRYAAGLAKQYASQLVLVHAYQPVVLASPYDDGTAITMLRQHEAMAQQQFAALSSSLPAATRACLTLSYQLELGLPADILIAESETLKPDLVVVGIKGEHAILPDVIGSTTTALIQRLAYPLLIVPEHAAYRGFDRIAYATDYQEDDLRVIDELLYFAKQYQAKLSCVHVTNHDSLYPSYQQELLKRTYNYDLVHEHIDFQTITHHDVVEGLRHYADWQRSDLLVMLTHHRSRIGQLFRYSHCRQLARKTTLPVWIYPAQTSEMAA
jgi:nucleotide-binding universal stress UspA family protein